MMATSKEFEDLDAAQEAIRLWYKDHPGQDVQLGRPDLVEKLARAQKCHDAARQKALDAKTS